VLTQQGDKMNLRNCPRCNERTYETLRTHSHCLCCNYSPDLLGYRKSSADDLPIPPWAAKAAERKQTQRVNPSVVIVDTMDSIDPKTHRKWFKDLVKTFATSNDMSMETFERIESKKFIRSRRSDYY